uniref:Nuclear receptor domain-containing protein n=1 Tax=Meloidogyne incognita TaxID=6306 RepID=A0A914KQG2_MELIC
MPSKRLINDIICVICGDRNSINHYGVISCRACGAFFRRMAIHNVDYKCKCHKHDWKELRCKRCRYKHCLAKGMKKELVLSVRLHDFRKKRSLEIMQNTQAKKGSSLAINELTCNEPTVIQTELGQMLKIESFVRRIRHSSTMIPMEYFDDYNCLEDLLNSGHNILTKSEAFSVGIFKFKR